MEKLFAGFSVDGLFDRGLHERQINKRVADHGYGARAGSKYSEGKTGLAFLRRRDHSG